MVFIKGWSFSDRVSPIAACFFFSHKFLVNLSRQDLIDSVAAQHQGFQNDTKLARLSRLHFPFVCHFLHHCPFPSPELCAFHTSNAGRSWIKTHESSSQLFYNFLFWSRKSFSLAKQRRRTGCIKQNSKYTSPSKRISSAGPCLCQSNKQSAKITKPQLRTPWVWLVPFANHNNRNLAKKKGTTSWKLELEPARQWALVPVVCEHWLNSFFPSHLIPNFLLRPPIYLVLKTKPTIIINGHPPSLPF